MNTYLNSDLPQICVDTPPPPRMWKISTALLWIKRPHDAAKICIDPAGKTPSFKKLPRGGSVLFGRTQEVRSDKDNANN